MFPWYFMNVYGLKHARPTKDQRDSFFFNPPPSSPPPSVANELASQESKMWFSGGRILAGGVRTVLARWARIAICPPQNVPQPQRFQNSVFSNYVQFNEVRSGSHKNHVFSNIRILFKMNTIFGWNHLKRPFLKTEQMRWRGIWRRTTWQICF